MPVLGQGTISVQLPASKFRRLISHYRDKSPSGVMKITFDPDHEWLQIDRDGVHCKFLEP